MPDERTERETALLRLLQRERKRWDAIRDYAHTRGDSDLIAAMDAATAERDELNDLEPDGWVWRPKVGDGRWQFRRRLEGRGYGRDAQIVPVLILDDWGPARTDAK